MRGKTGGRSQSLDDISPSLRVAVSSPLAIHRHLSGEQRSRARPCDQHWIGLGRKAGGRSQSLGDISPSLRVAASSPLAIRRHLGSEPVPTLGRAARGLVSALYIESSSRLGAPRSISRAASESWAPRSISRAARASALRTLGKNSGVPSTKYFERTREEKKQMSA